MSLLIMMISVVLIILKLTDNINWSWWWVISPILIGIIIVFIIGFLKGIGNAQQEQLKQEFNERWKEG